MVLHGFWSIRTNQLSLHNPVDSIQHLGVGNRHLIADLLQPTKPIGSSLPPTIEVHSFNATRYSYSK